MEKNNPKQTNLGRKKDAQHSCSARTSASVGAGPGVALGFQSGSRQKVPPPSASTAQRRRWGENPCNEVLSGKEKNPHLSSPEEGRIHTLQGFHFGVVMKPIMKPLPTTAPNSTNPGCRRVHSGYYAGGMELCHGAQNAGENGLGVVNNPSSPPPPEGRNPCPAPALSTTLGKFLVGWVTNEPHTVPCLEETNRSQLRYKQNVKDVTGQRLLVRKILVRIKSPLVEPVVYCLQWTNLGLTSPKNFPYFYPICPIIQGMSILYPCECIPYHFYVTWRNNKSPTWFIQGQRKDG